MKALRMKHPRGVYYVILSAVLWMFILGMYRWWPYAGKAMVEYYDGQSQHFVAFVYFGKYVRHALHMIFVEHSFAIPTFSFSIGYGQDIIGTLQYYILGDPFGILSVFAKPGHAEFAYSVAIMLRVYCAGLAFSIFIRSRRISDYQSFIATLVYVFAGFIISAAARHPYFTNPMIYLPLLCLGVDRLMTGRGWKLLTFMTFIMVMSNFYFFYILTLLIFLYGVYRFFELNKLRGNIRKLGRILVHAALSYGLGVLMGACLLFPVLKQFMQTDRSSVGPVTELLYPKEFYLNLPKQFISPVYGAQYWTLTAFLPIVILIFAAVILQCIRRESGAWLDMLGILVLFGIMLSPVMGSIFNGMSYSTNRWIFGLDFFVALLTAKYLPTLVDISRKNDRMRLFILAIVLLVAVFIFKMNHPIDSRTLVGLVFLGGYVAVVFTFTSNKWTKYALIFLTMLNVVAYCAYAADVKLFPGKLNSYTNKDIVKNDYYAYKSSVIYDQYKRDHQWSRYELSDNGNDYRAELNNALIRGTNGTSFYFSLANSNIFAFNKGVENNIASDFEYYGLDNRAELSTLANVKYYALADDESKSQVPYGFKFLRKVKKDGHVVTLYRNGNWLPFGYTYDKYVVQKGKLSALQLMSTMPQSVVVNRNFKGLKSAKASTAGFSVASSHIIKTDGVSVKGTQYDVSKPNGSVTFNVQVPKGTNLLAQIRGIDYPNPPETGTFGKNITGAVFTFHYGNLSKGFSYHNQYNSWYTGINNTTLNLGPSHHGQTVTLNFSSVGGYTLKNIKFYARDYSQLSSQIAKLRQSRLRHVTFTSNRITGSIDLNTAKILLLTIPYGDGWQAYDNGKPIEVHKANLMFSALLLSKGHHHITMRYSTPGLKVGLIVSGFAWAGFICLIGLSWHGKKKLESVSNFNGSMPSKR